ncbi:MAG: hypothetical protein AAGF12_25565, partial [Myxococcota bacterium]
MALVAGCESSTTPADATLADSSVVDSSERDAVSDIALDSRMDVEAGGEDPNALARDALRANLRAFSAAGLMNNTLDWQPCRLRTGTDAQCTSVTLPANWYDVSDPRRVEVVLTRVDIGTPTHQLWLLPGGPIPSAEGHESVDFLRGLGRVNARLYLVNFRGFAPGTTFECPEQRSPLSPGGARILTSELADCAATLDSQIGLAGFTTTQLSAGEEPKLVSRSADIDPSQHDLDASRVGDVIPVRRQRN